MSLKLLRSASDWALIVGLVFGTGAVAQAQNENEGVEGPVIQIGKADESTTPNIDEDQSQDTERPTAPKYWIGLAGSTISPEHVLRAHIDLPENQGLLIASVVPDSPAAKSGLKQHDILLRANGVDLHEMTDLTDIVMAEGAKKGQIELEILRKGARETVYITPEDRPANVPQPQLGNSPFGGGFGEFGAEGLPDELLERFQNRLPMEFRNLGPGIIVGGQGVGDVPSGVSINIKKDGDKPVHITVTRGDETWEVAADDPESLNQLPEDLRPFVERMLNGGSPLELNLGDRIGREPMPELGDGRLRERLDRMEKRMQDLLDRLEQQNRPADEAPVENPADDQQN